MTRLNSDSRRIAFLWRVGAVLLLLLVYVFLWRSGRAWLTQEVAHPAFSAMLSPAAQVERMEDPLMLAVHSTEGGTAHFRAPAGILFLLPALILVGCFPRRPYWFYFWLYHLGLGLLTWMAIWWAAGGYSSGFVALGFLRGYIEPATSLAAPILVLWVWRTEPGDPPVRFTSRK